MKKIPFFAAWLILIGCFIALNLNNQSRFEKLTGTKDEVGRYRDKTAVNLDADLNTADLAHILELNGYVGTKADADYVARFITGRIAEGHIPEAIFDFKKSEWAVPADKIDEDSPESFRVRLQEERVKTGWTPEIDSLYYKDSIPSEVQVGEGTDGVMTVTVKDPKPDEEITFFHKAFKLDRHNPAPGVIVRLQKIMRGNRDTIQTAVLAYARTDSLGEATFSGLSAESSYSVLPIKDGYSYGYEKGTYRGTWGDQVDNDETKYDFVSRPLAVKLFHNQTLTNMRDAEVVTVRTPDDFSNGMAGYMAVFLVVWMIVFVIGNSGGRKMDNLMAAVIMLLSGLGMLLMYGINNPLTEKVLGTEMAEGCIFGTVLIGAILFGNMRSFFYNKTWVKFEAFFWFIQGVWGLIYRLLRIVFYHILYKLILRPLLVVVDFLGMGRLLAFLYRMTGLDNLCLKIRDGWRSLYTKLAPVRRFFSKMGGGIKSVWGWLLSFNGISYFMAAVLLALMLALFGQSVGGMKVNLHMFVTFQPSEIIKFLFVFFIAAFFFERGDRIVAYSEGGDQAGYNLKQKFLTMGTMLLAMMVLMFFYFKNSDMGPALVVALTFIMVYSLVKSKFVYGSNDGSKATLAQFMHTDLFMLIIGVMTYIVILLVGNSIMGEPGMILATVLWYVGWWYYGWYVAGNRVYETPMMFNGLIAIFVLLGTAIKDIPLLKDIGERLVQRNAMCSNIWGELGGEPGINTQVAEGLWALASGGFTGQGLGNAQAHYIPAFHTDMILQSIGEIMGFFGIAGVILLLSVLLGRTIRAGYRSGHRFLLFLCFGIAVITGIQLFIITLGSLGIIPLTGISVPFFSYGRVSLIMNLVAFGIALAVSSHAVQDEKTVARMEPYRMTAGLLTLAYMSLTVFVLAVAAHYMVGPERKRTLTRELYVYDTSGAAVVKYNPRITYLTSHMKAGNIFDRNGILLATSDPKLLTEGEHAEVLKDLNVGDMKTLAAKVQRRYYPFGEQMFFMVGDANSRYYFPSVDTEPFGYLAEARHMSDMRGFDNRRFKNGAPHKIVLRQDKYRDHKFLPPLSPDFIEDKEFQLRDYEVLLPFIEQGSHSSLLDDYNAGKSVTSMRGDSLVEIQTHDIHLTIDAKLQTGIQNMIADFLKTNHTNKKYRRYQRTSIVVLDAINGDLLASANYPLPDYDRIEQFTGEFSTNKGIYSDYNRPLEWTSFTERDLGLTYMTKPGSTGKTMSSLASFMHMDKTGYSMDKSGEYAYRVYRDEIIHVENGSEPVSTGPNDKVNLHRAIVNSSNIYFINLVNDLELYDELAEIYGRAGHRVAPKIGTKAKYAMPYPDKVHAEDEIPEDFISTVTYPAENAVNKYRKYIEQREKPGGFIRKMRNNDWGADEWMWAWGEGSLDATPAAMARVAAAAATGKMPRPRYLMDEAVHRDVIVKDAKNLEHLRKAMKDEAAKSIKDKNVGGKTGTPERAFTNDSIRNVIIKGKKMEYHNKNDGWYIAFIDNTNTPGEKDGDKGKIAVAIRVERTMEPRTGSGYAKGMMREVVLPVLRELQYLE